MSATARDFARLGQLYIQKGNWGGRQIIDSSYVEQSVSPAQYKNGKADFYGYQWWLNRGDENLRWPSLPEGSFAAMGNRQQRVMVVPTHDLVIVRLGWTAGSYPDDEHYAKIIAALPR